MTKTFQIKLFFTLSLLLLPLSVYGSFIEATMGAAVVDDATAAYYNPAALTLLKNPQIIALGSIASFHTQTSGQATQIRTGFTLSGTTEANTNYYLPSAYLGLPATDNIFLGTAVISNLFNRDIEPDSILRYVESDNRVQAIDIVPAIGIKVNKYLSLGGALNFSRANFLMKPTSGLPTLNIPDAQSRNETNANAWGGDLGFLLKPTSSTLVGFNYRSAITYPFHGTSTLEGNPGISSDQYSFDFWTPARYVLSVSQRLQPTLGVIGTVQWVQWGIFDKVNIHNIATQIGSLPVILPNATVQYHLHNSWIFTLGSQYNATSKWTIRVAGSYLQSPGNPNYQVTNGDNIIVGASAGYKLTKNIIIDGSYAHAFVKNQNINIANAINRINALNKGYRDSVSLKLTFNL